MIAGSAALVLGIVALLLINGSAVVKDSRQNLQMAVNLAHCGTMSGSDQPPCRPSMYRESLPVLVSAAMVRVVDGFLGKADNSQYFSGARVKYIKWQNAAWLMLLGWAVFCAARYFTASWVWAILAALLSVKPFLTATNVQGVNDLYTELPAAVLMTGAVYWLVKAVNRDSRVGFLAAGLCYGLLALAKAAMLYLFIGLLIVLLATYVKRALRARRLLNLLVLFAGAALVVTPWVARNWLTFGQAQISERGGLVLYTRALMNQVTPTEYRGSFYVWARPSLQPLVGRLLGFSAQDLALGGRLQRLNDDLGTELYQHDLRAEQAGRPQDAITLHRQARAERVRLESEFEAQRIPYPEVAADGAMAREGATLIEHNFGADLALAVPLIWRCAPVIFPALVITLAYALRSRKYLLALLVLPGLGLVVFYALATHFEPRPAIVAQSTAAIGVIVMLDALWQLRPRWLRRLGVSKC